MGWRIKYSQMWSSQIPDTTKTYSYYIDGRIKFKSFFYILLIYYLRLEKWDCDRLNNDKIRPIWFFIFVHQDIWKIYSHRLWQWFRFWIKYQFNLNASFEHNLEKWNFVNFVRFSLWYRWVVQSLFVFEWFHSLRLCE